MNDLSKSHLFTHAGCMDGAASVILFMSAGGLEKNVHYTNAGQLERKYEDEKRVFQTAQDILIVDVAPSRDDLADELSRMGTVTVIDHHKTSARFAGKKNFFIDVENTACGSENFRQWLVGRGFNQFNTPAWRRFCAIVDDHDRWQLKIPFSREMPKLLSFVGQREFIKRIGDDIHGRFAVEKESYWTPLESELIKMISDSQERRFRNILQHKFQIRERQHDGKTVKIGYLISDEINNSELLQRYLNEHPEVDAACQISFGLQKVSFRSRPGGFDVAEFASKFGGGGHSVASGHALPPGLLIGIIDGMHK